MARKKPYKKDRSKSAKLQSRSISREEFYGAIGTVLDAVRSVTDSLSRNVETRDALLALYEAVRETVREQTGTDPQPVEGTAMWQAEQVLFGSSDGRRMARVREASAE